MNTLFTEVDRYARHNTGADGIVHTPVPGLTIVWSDKPNEIDHAISRPLACLILQGAKQVSTSGETRLFGSGDSLLITADVPTINQIVRASASQPYCSLVLDLDLAIITELATEMSLQPAPGGQPMHNVPTDTRVADSALRLMLLLQRPEAIPILCSQLLREIHYWLLTGQHGAAIRELGIPDSQIRRIARVVALLRAEFARPLTISRLAAEAGMSPSSLYQHFRAVTTLSPLQFQKQLRLIEGRRLMRAEGMTVSSAAFATGYESVSHFTREYRRMFGRPPSRDLSKAV